MDPSDFPLSRSPRKELQGPRPTPLKIHKDSHKIRKPPPAAPPSQPWQAPAGAHNPPRQPVIIYTVSPKIIHTNPSDFMNLVQRLTGRSSSSSTEASAATTRSNTTANPNFYGAGAISPAARYAAMEKANSPQGVRNLTNMKSSVIGNINHDHQHASTSVLGFEFDQIESSYNINYNNNSSIISSKGFFSGILSPGPASLPPIAPNFFSPPSDGFFHDLSPVILGNRNFIEGTFVPSPMEPNSLFTSPRPSMSMTSPTTPTLDYLLNNIFHDNF